MSENEENVVGVQRRMFQKGVNRPLYRILHFQER